MDKTLEELQAEITKLEAKLRQTKQAKQAKIAGYSKNRTFRHPRVKANKHFGSNKNHGVLRSSWGGVEKSSIFKRRR